MIEFTVIDTKTMEYPDCEKLALTEDWAKHLIYCDIDGFYLGEDGALVLVDDCGNAAFPPPGRFQVVPLVGNTDDSALLLALAEDAAWCDANEWEIPITMGDHIRAAIRRVLALSPKPYKPAEPKEENK